MGIIKNIKGTIIFVEWGIWATLYVEDDNNNIHKIGMPVHQLHRYNYKPDEKIYAKFEYGKGWTIKRIKN